MKTLAFAGSNSSHSINQELINYIESLLNDENFETIKLTNYRLPIYSEDEEMKGFPVDLYQLYKKLRSAELLVISAAEHNRNMSAFLKNIIDWLSRLEFSFLSGKKVLIMSASPGQAGGRSVLNILKATLPNFGGEVVGEFSLSKFNENFKSGEISSQIKKQELLNTLNELMTTNYLVA
jgi:NAD(P)H-dependent FMN reductase